MTSNYLLQRLRSLAEARADRAALYESRRVRWHAPAEPQPTPDADHHDYCRHGEQSTNCGRCGTSLWRGADEEG